MLFLELTKPQMPDLDCEFSFHEHCEADNSVSLQAN